jgi:hypothetical protein
VSAGKVIHAIVDNYAAHKQPNVLEWLAYHPRWTFHFTPTLASWLNAHNNDCRPFTWTTSAKAIFEKFVQIPISSA